MLNSKIMFNPSSIQSCLMGLVGFPQNYLKDHSDVDADLTSSASGVMLDQSAHPLITLENISAAAKDYLTTDVKDYDAAKTYALNDVVVSANVVYYSLQADNLNHAPASSADYWQSTTLVSMYLRRVMKGAANNLFNTVFTQKKLYQAAKTLLTDISLYEGMGNLKNKIVKTGRFVGYQITPRQPDTVITISQVGFQGDTIQEELPFYLYHDSQSEPIATFNLNISKAISFTWNSLTTALKLIYGNADTGSGGNYYLGYYEDDLDGQAIWRQTSYTPAGCSSCSGNNGIIVGKWNKYVSVQPVYVDADFLDEDGNLFDVDKIIYINSQNWGLNLRLNVQCDVSDLICRNKYVFTDAYKLQIVKDMLNDMAYSVRDNQLKEKVRQMAMLALKGDKQDYSKGVESDLASAIKAISFDLSEMNSICLSCANGMGIEVSSVYK